MKDIINKYQNIYHLKEEKLTVNNFYNQDILLIDNSPVYIKNYRLPHSQFDDIETQVTKLLDDAIIEPSITPYNSPLLERKIKEK